MNSKAVESLRSEQNKYEASIRDVREELHELVTNAQKRDEALESENVRIKRENVRLAATLKRERTNTQAEIFRAMKAERDKVTATMLAEKDSAVAEASEQLEKQRKMTMKLEDEVENMKRDKSSLRRSLRTMKGVAGVLAAAGVSLGAAFVSAQNKV